MPQTAYRTKSHHKYRLASISAVHRSEGAFQSTAPGYNLSFELGEATQPKLSPTKLAIERPVALLALVPRAAVLFGAGALSGAIAKTITAPLDRVKILLQVKGGLEGGAVAAAAAKGNLLQSLIAIGKQEGLLGYWKGNLPQVQPLDTAPCWIPLRFCIFNTTHLYLRALQGSHTFLLACQQH